MSFWRAVFPLDLGVGNHRVIADTGQQERADLVAREAHKAIRAHVDRADRLTDVLVVDRVTTTRAGIAVAQPREEILTVGVVAHNLDAGANGKPLFDGVLGVKADEATRVEARGPFGCGRARPA
jgi:hypothetical protein